MAIFQGIFLLIMGILLSVITLRSLKSGWLPFGSNGLKGRLEIKRAEKPVGFWLVFLFYAGGSVAITIYGLFILFGISAPMPMS